MIGRIGALSMAFCFTLSTAANGADTRALGAGAPPAAEARYQVGLSLYRQGRFAEAAAEFRGALAMVPGSGKAAYNLGRCEERAGDLDAAIKAYRTYIGLEQNADERRPVESLVVALEARVREKLPDVTVATKPDGAQAFLDYAKEPAGLTPLRLKLTPGSHHLVLKKDGFTAEERTVAVRAGEATAVQVELVALAAPAPPPAPVSVAPAPVAPTAAASTLIAPTVEPEPEPEPSSSLPAWRKWGGIAGLGLGAVGAGLGGYFLYSAGSAVDDAGGADDEAKYDRLKADYEGDTTAGAVCLGLGGVLISGGLVLLFGPDF